MANKAQDMRSALDQSMRAEESRVKDRKLDRFARAEKALESDEAEKEELLESPVVEHEKIIRKTFSLPANDYALISTLQDRGLNARVHATKSEIVRAGLWVLSEMQEYDLVAALQKVEKVKTGRPSK